jgi:hypothetical protein
MIWRIPLFLVLVVYGAWCAVTFGVGGSATNGEQEASSIWQIVAFFLLLILVYNLYIVLTTKVLVDGFGLSNEFSKTGSHGTINTVTGHVSVHDRYESARSYVFKFVAGAQWFGFLILLVLSSPDIQLISVPIGAPGFRETTGALFNFLGQVL